MIGVVVFVACIGAVVIADWWLCRSEDVWDTVARRIAESRKREKVKLPSAKLSRRKSCDRNHQNDRENR